MGRSIHECLEGVVSREIVEVEKLIGVYTTPDLIIEYHDNLQPVSLCFFAANIVDGELGLSGETADVGYFSVQEIKAMDVGELIANA